MAEHLPIAQAKARFAECVRRAEGGESVILTRHGRPVARLAPVGPSHAASSDEVSDDVREPRARYGAASEESTPPVSAAHRREALERLLEEVIWPRIPAEQLGRALTRAERERILGYGSDGV